MGSLVARTAHSVARFCASAVAGIWRGLGGTLSSGVLHYRSHTEEGVDGRVPPGPEASEASDALAKVPLAGKFPPLVLKTQTFGANRPYASNASPQRKWDQDSEGFTVGEIGSGEYAENAHTEHGLGVPNQIRQTGGELLGFRFLNACGSPPAFIGGNKFFGGFIRNGACESDVRDPGIMTVNGVSVRRLLGAQVLNKHCLQAGIGGRAMHTRSAGTASEKIAILEQRHRQGIEIDSYSLVEVLKLCSKQEDLLATRRVHDWIFQSGMDMGPYVASALMNAYVLCSRLKDAHRVFDAPQTTYRNVVTWTVLIGGYAKGGFGEKAYRLFLQMKREGFVPNAVTYVCILNASASAGALEWVRAVHNDAVEAGLVSNVRVGNALVHMYAKSGSIDDARVVFDRMKTRDVITWNVMIGAYAQKGNGMEAHRLFLQMKREGFKPDEFTYTPTLNACASAGALKWVKAVHSDALGAGLESDVCVGTALVHVYAKSGSIDDARVVFDRMQTRDVVTWNAMIGAYARKGNGMEAYRLFLQMKQEGFKPNEFTYTSILNGSASRGALEWVKAVHRDALGAGLESDVCVGNALVHMYAKSGSIDDARVVFDRMQSRDVITWTAMIGAYAEKGRGMEAYRLFLQMKREGLKPNEVTYISILNASASAGALEWVKAIHSDALVAGLESDVRVGNALVHMYAKCGSINDARLVFSRMERRDVATGTAMIGGLEQHGCRQEALELGRQMNAKLRIPD